MTYPWDNCRIVLMIYGFLLYMRQKTSRNPWPLLGAPKETSGGYFGNRTGFGDNNRIHSLLREDEVAEGKCPDSEKSEEFKCVR